MADLTILDLLLGLGRHPSVIAVALGRSENAVNQKISRSGRSRQKKRDWTKLGASLHKDGSYTPAKRTGKARRHDAPTERKRIVAARRQRAAAVPYRDGRPIPPRC